MATTEVTPKRGAIPSPRIALAAATPHIAVPGVPPSFLWKPARLSFWGNDVHGDCVTAEEAFAKACNNPEIFIPDTDVDNWAARHGVLEGAYLTQVMQYMQNDGFLERPYIYDDGPYQTVNWTDPNNLQSAISIGPVKLGVAADQLLQTWYHRAIGGSNVWFATGYHAEPPASEDHCVALCGYGTIAWLAGQLGVAVPAGIDGTQSAYAMFTWDSIGIIDRPSLLAITFEAWLRRPTTLTKVQAETWVFRTFTSAQGPAAVATYLNEPMRQGAGEVSLGVRGDGSLELYFLEPGTLGSSATPSWMYENFTAVQGPAAVAHFLNEPMRQGAGQANVFIRGDGSLGLLYLEPGTLGETAVQQWMYENFTGPQAPTRAVAFLNEAPRQGRGEACVFMREDGSVGVLYLEAGSLATSTQQTWFYRPFTADEGPAAAVAFLNASPRQGPGEACICVHRDGSVGLFFLEPGTA